MAELKKYLDSVALGTLVDQIKSEDAKALAAAKKYTDDSVALCDVAGSAATAEQNAKSYTDELANGQVKTNKEAIAKLNGSATEEGSVAKAVADAKTEMQGKIDAVSGVANQNKADIAAINNEESGILAQAKTHAEGKVAEVQGAVDELAELVGELPEGTSATTVVEYVNAKTAGIATDAALEELNNQLSGVQGEVATIKGDYLKGADKTELEGKITEVSTAVATEKSRAEGVEAGFETRIAAIEGDYLKAADKTELQGNIDTLTGVVETLRDGVDAEKVDGVLDLINYVEEHGPEVTGMKEDIAENAEAIEGVTGRVGTLEGKMTAVEGAVATKVEQEAYNAKVAALEGEDTAIKGRLDAIEAELGDGEGSVTEQIAAAKAAAISEAVSQAEAKDSALETLLKKYADDEDAKIEERVSTLETESAKHALASDLTALSGRVTTAEGEIDTLQSEMDAVEAKASANETAIGTINTELAKKAAQADLEAATGRISANETAISGLQTTVAGKAESSALAGAVERIAKNETDIAGLTTAVNSFTAITSEEVNALFA